jgi:hypothetical protein
MGRQQGRAWSAWDVQALIAMRAAGSTAAEIGWALDRSPGAVHVKASALGVTKRRPEARRLHAA